PVAELLARLRQTQAGVSEFLAAQGAEPNTEARVAESYFGETNWKGYALILRLHYRDHAEQVRKTLAAVARRAGLARPRRSASCVIAEALHRIRVPLDSTARPRRADEPTLLKSERFSANRLRPVLPLHP